MRRWGRSRRGVLVASSALALAAAASIPALAHPLGNFSINRWASVVAADGSIRIDYVVDFAEIPTYQESPLVDSDGDGKESAAEIQSFARKRAGVLGEGLELTLGGRRLPLRLGESALEFTPGAAGLRTMRLSGVFESAGLPAMPEGSVPVEFLDRNFEGRAGWREIVAFGSESVAVVDSSVPATDLSRALTAYPADLIMAPPQISSAGFRLLTGAAAARALAAGIASVDPGRSVPGRSAPGTGRPGTADGLSRLIGPAGSGFSLSVLVAAFAAAIFWGGVHALSPGHGKTVVAAYLVGQRGAPIHALWLGLIVTFTHTIGVFALGALTLLLSRWFVPESLYPWLGFVSGLTVVTMGAVLLVRRWRRRASNHAGHDHAGRGHEAHSHADHDHADHDHADPGNADPGNADHGHAHHGHAGHTHAMPERLSGRGLVALGVSGGLVPCPSALVVLLSAVAFHRVLFGMALIVAFSAGLAAVLVAVGLLMVYARSLFDRLDSRGTLSGRLGLLSAAAILLLGAGIVAQSIPPPLRDLAAAFALSPTWGALGILGLGLLFGLKHATEADHLAAVSSMVSEDGGLRRALMTGGLWGAGHTLSIVVAGLFVLGLHLVIPAATARWLEIGVALMIIGLGGAALSRALRNHPAAHLHAHRHEQEAHTHLHFHEEGDGHAPGGGMGEAPAAESALHLAHRFGRIGMKPLLVGMMHGLAGSAALTLLVLAQIKSAALGVVYLLVFGAGSVAGMALMSLAIGLPFAATASRPRMNRGLRTATGAFSLGFGLFYAWSLLAMR